MPKLVVWDCCLFKVNGPAHRLKIPENMLVVHSAKLNKGSTANDEVGAEYSAILAEELKSKAQTHRIRQILQSSARRVNKELMDPPPSAASGIALVPNAITAVDDTTFDELYLGAAPVDA